MGRALQPAPAGNPVAFHYERRRPEATTLYQIVQEQLETFLAQVEAQSGSGLPAFVKDDFEAYLECGGRRWNSCSAWPRWCRARAYI